MQIIGYQISWFCVSIIFNVCIFFDIFFFLKEIAKTKIYTLSLHDALPISILGHFGDRAAAFNGKIRKSERFRSEEHTSELQSRGHLVCRLLLEKKNKKSICSETLVREITGFQISRDRTT